MIKLTLRNRTVSNIYKLMVFCVVVRHNHTIVMYRISTLPQLQEKTKGKRARKQRTTRPQPTVRRVPKTTKTTPVITMLLTFPRYAFTFPPNRVKTSKDILCFENFLSCAINHISAPGGTILTLHVLRWEGWVNDSGVHTWFLCYA